MSEFNTISGIFTEVETGQSVIRVSVQRLMNILSRKAFDYYSNCFRNRLYDYLKLYYREKKEVIDRVMLFVAEFCACIQEEHSALNPDSDSQCVTSILQFLCQMTTAVDAPIRYRSCQFIANVCYVTNACNFTSSLRDSITQSLLTSLTDAVPHVRAEAVLGLITFQDEKKVTCPVATALAQLMNSEPFPRVRRACVDYICLKEELMNTVIKACVDNDYNIRLSLYKRAQSTPTAFKIRHKQYIIFNAIYGRAERADEILKFVNEHMYPSWLEAYKFDYMRLLRLLRIDSSWEDILKSEAIQESVLRALFKVRPMSEIVNVLNLNQDALLNVDEVNWDSCLYWRVLVTHALSQDSDEHIKKIIPALPLLQKFIEKYCTHLRQHDEYYLNKYKYQFILIQLFKLIGEYLRSAQVTNQLCIYTLSKTVLKNFDLDFDALKEIMLLLKVVIPEEEKRIAYICGQAVNILSALKKRKPQSEEERLANYNTIAKWVNVVGALLYPGAVTKITPDLVEFKLNFLDSWIPHDDINVKTAAVRCFGYYSMLDENIAKKTVSIFCKILIAHNKCALVDSSELICSCIGIVVDTVIAYGPSIFYTHSKNENQITLSMVIQNLRLLLDDKDMQIQQVTGRGLCKFLLKKQILSHKIMVPLILKYFTIDTRANINFVILQHYIEITFGRLTHLPEVVGQFEKAVLESVQTVVDAPEDTLVGSIDIGTLTNFLISLCNSLALTSKICVYLGNEILKNIINNPALPHKQIFVKMAQMMKCSPKNKMTLIKLIHETNDIKKLLHDKECLKYVKIFNTYFTLLLQRSDDSQPKKGG